MATPTTISESIEQSALQGKQTVSAGGTSVSAMSIDDQIKAARYLAGETAKQSRSVGLRISRSVGNRGGL